MHAYAHRTTLQLLFPLPTLEMRGRVLILLLLQSRHRDISPPHVLRRAYAATLCVRVAFQVPLPLRQYQLLPLHLLPLPPPPRPLPLPPSPPLLPTPLLLLAYLRGLIYHYLYYLFAYSPQPLNGRTADSQQERVLAGEGCRCNCSLRPSNKDTHFVHTLFKIYRT